MDPKSTPQLAQNLGRQASPKGVQTKIDLGVDLGKKFRRCDYKFGFDV